ncbi:MAG: oligosaccharide repeat unit polymerase family protein [Methanobrevibacter sp.]|uniref:oligosaccharide repeat unit polymerase family protein n=1 Tax=Methanobrevibacter sp. TaxID=66852 RepID=UPI0025D35A24|nr:oligosaccharide repeat unit polymerase family protein [Methanobrevibacter sp.]MBQ6099632.1 oligosaccharide repeat unit polymerase family protein [Methanobrevibacter sp.]MBQ6100637.1 oligosaccharide repeat unit polymerase family protein [Methanobrevibacter sp.]
MDFKKIDFFQPLILVVAILAFLAMGYIGSFNYRFEDPLDLEVILTVIFACIVFTAGDLIIKYKIKVENIKKTDFLSEKLLLILVLIALVLQTLNLVFIGGIPLFNSVLKSNATTDIWRVAYPLFLIMINVLLAKHYERKYLILVLLGAFIFGLNGYRTSVLGILASSFITLYYLNKISGKTGILFIAVMVIAITAMGYIASQSIATQHWTLNPVELIFYRAGFTLEVFERILPLGATTHGHILSLIFSPGSPRTFVGQYVLSDNVCLTSTLFGPVYLDFGLTGLTVQMLFMGIFLGLMDKLKKGVGVGIYSIILTHTLIWIETGPTDIMIWFLYLIGFILILINFNYIKLNKN